MVSHQVPRKVGQHFLVTLSDLSCVITCPLSLTHTHTIPALHPAAPALQVFRLARVHELPYLLHASLANKYVNGQGTSDTDSFLTSENCCCSGGRGRGLPSVHVRALALMWKCKPCVVS